jgi:mono/diheme cytochrome c family protein
MMPRTYLISVCTMAVLVVHGPVLAQGTAGGGSQGSARAAATGPRTGTPPTSPVTGDSVKGKKLFFDYACYSCHGYNGETGVRQFVPNWPATLASESSFIAFLRGRANAAPVQPSTSMPNYAAQSLSDMSAKDIYAYIRTFKSNAPPADQIAVFKQILGSAQHDRSAATPK